MGDIKVWEPGDDSAGPRACPVCGSVGTGAGMPAHLVERHGYDSRPDTWEHIDQVRRLLSQVVRGLNARADDHDKSKLVSPEVEVFDEFTPKLKATTYDSSEYREFLVGMGEGLQHHYAVNDHHPEHFLNGIHDMDLLQVIEMLCDWKAATMRHDDGDLFNSIQLNAGRFGYGDEIRHLLLNTARNLGWI